MAELSGKDKESESVFDIFEIFRSLRHEFGQVTVNFGSPVPLKEFIDDNIPEWQSLKEIPPIKLSETSLNLANMLAISINKAVAIKSTDLIALALLATSKQNIEEEYLLKQVELLRQIARTCIPAGASVTSARPEEMLNQAMKIVGLSRIEHAFGSIISSSKNQSRILAYNANNVAHVYTLPSLVLRFVTAKRQTDKIALLEFVTTLYPFLKSEMFLSWAISELNEVLETIVHLLQELGLVTTNGQQLSMPSQETSIQNSIQHIASITDQPLTRFYTIMELLQQSIKPTLKNLESASASISEKLSILYGINSTEFFDKSLFSAFLRTLKSENLLRDDLTVKKDFSLLVSMTAQSLDPDIRYNIFQAVKKFEN
ncbi:MAG: hypothetical protein CL429_03675 [Acidimicrobiaceae bacterium]|nr:hypothetical protein [Acidimicrobiaceae bacterium]